MCAPVNSMARCSDAMRISPR